MKNSMLTVKVNEVGTRTFVKTNLPFSVEMVAGHLFVSGSEFAQKTREYTNEWFVISREINDRAAYESR